ncbi:Arginine biosynthesis bifunctional protein ArgJ beta chain [Amanita muscaria]
MTSNITLFKRLSSTISFKPTPSKSHLHKPIQGDLFPSGYLLTGIHSGVKKNKSGSPVDLAVILSTSPRPTSAAACFTRNAFKAAPVLVSEEVLVRNGGRARAVVVNSGCANAVTGARGLEDAWKMVKATDALLSSTPDTHTSETLVMSTGVIGQHLPITSILSAISSLTPPSSLSSTFSAWERAAQAFMTTDTFPKLRARTFQIGDKTYRLAGMDKGAGMIHPSMRSAKTGLHATLLGCVLTDAPVSPRSLQSALTYAVDRSFNSISVDGEMSTNDTIVALANGAAAAEEKELEIDEERNEGEYLVFRDELTSFTQELAQLVVRDGEGATKFVAVTVKGASSYAAAHSIASRISISALVKTALYGEDANWGRILAATGSVPLSPEIEPARVSVTFVPADGSALLRVLTDGEPERVDEVRAKKVLEMEDVNIEVDLGMGNEEATYWTCDFSYEYVRINGDYRS